jgi:hypothetical protein
VPSGNGNQHRRESALTGLLCDLDMTFIWFITWLISNSIGDREPLLFDPVNAWAGTLLLVVALDLAGGHTRSATKGR